MYVVIVTGGKQYKVAEGDVLYIEKLDAQAEENVTFDTVLAIGADDSFKAGKDCAKATVDAKVLKNGKGKKILYLLTSQRRTKNARRVIVSHTQRLRLPRLMRND